MMVHCEKCQRNYDDAARWTICPHNALWVGADTPYCAKHDLYDCYLCELPALVPDTAPEA